VNKEHKHNYPLSKRIAARVFPILIRVIIHTIHFTCKKKFLLPKEQIKTPAIWVAWHGQIILIPYIYKQIGETAGKIHIIVSEHLHGDFAIRIFKNYINFDFIRGSSRKGAIKALKSAIEKLQMGENVGITPDGPKGPLHSVSDGAITLSLKCNVPVIAIGWSADRYWQLKSWDEARIPKPFSTIMYKISNPIYIDKNDDKNKVKDIIKNAIMDCMN
jgi:lysophospholipid acyltransferase (LPLAT)-like uncharacterized protein